MDDDDGHYIVVPDSDLTDRCESLNCVSADDPG